MCVSKCNSSIRLVNLISLRIYHGVEDEIDDPFQKSSTRPNLYTNDDTKINTFWSRRLTPGQWLGSVWETKNFFLIRYPRTKHSMDKTKSLTFCRKTSHHHPNSCNNSSESQYEADENPNSCASSFEEASVKVIAT